MSVPDSTYMRQPDTRLGPAAPISAIDPQMANAMGLDPFAAAAATAAYNEALAIRAGMMHHPHYPPPPSDIPSRILYAQVQAQGYAQAAAAAAAAGHPNSPSPATPMHPHPLMIPHPLAAAASQLPRGYPYPPPGYYPPPYAMQGGHVPPNGRAGVKRGDLSIHTAGVKQAGGSGGAGGPVSAPAMMRGPPTDDGWNEVFDEPNIPGSVTGPLSPYSHLVQPPKVDQSLKKLSLYKTELCRSWEETGYCRYASKCQFAHSIVELRPVDRHPKYKTEMCKTFWEKGTCPYGKRCCFIHTERDLRESKDKGLSTIKEGKEGAGVMSPTGVTSPTSVLSPTNSSAGGMPRRRTTSMGSALSFDGDDGEYTYGSSYNTSPRLPPSSLDMPTAYGSMPILSSMPASQMPLSPNSYVYDHRAIAEAYFAGRRFSDVGVVHGNFERRVSDVGLGVFGDGGLERVEEEDGDDSGRENGMNGGSGLLTPISYRDERDGRTPLRSTLAQSATAASTPLHSGASSPYPLTPPLSNSMTPPRVIATSSASSNTYQSDGFPGDVQFPFDFDLVSAPLKTGITTLGSSVPSSASIPRDRRRRSITQPAGGLISLGGLGSPPSSSPADIAHLSSSLAGISLSPSFGGSLSAGSSPLHSFAAKRSGSFSGYLPSGMAQSVPNPSISLLSTSAGSPFLMK
ncbi:hypothetical protein HK097_000488, partial [Rhizophlyctis rosea]